MAILECPPPSITKPNHFPMTNIPRLSRAMQHALSQIPNTLARRCGFIQRQRKFTGALFVQTLVFGWLANTEASLEDLAQTAATLGLEVSAQAIDERFTEKAAVLLEGVLAQAVGRLLEGSAVSMSLLKRFEGVYLLDASVIGLPPTLAGRWPGLGGNTPEAGKAALKIEVMFDLVRGRLFGPLLLPGRRHDQRGQLPQQDLPQGALRLADLGYFSLDRLADLDHKGSFWVSRLKLGTRLYDQHGQAFDVLDRLEQAEKAGQQDLEARVQMGKRHRLEARLLAQRVSEEVAAERRRRLRRAAQKRGQTPSKRSLSLCAWTILVTNVPLAMLSFEEAMALHRARWQVELLFKLWKHYGGLDKSRSAQPWRVLCEVYAKLLAMLVQHWVLVVGLWSKADKSLVKASKTLKGHALHLAAHMKASWSLCQALEVVVRCLHYGCRMNSRARHPNTYQRLMASERLSLT